MEILQMMYHELQAAWKDAAKEHNDAVLSTGRSYGKVPDTLAVHETEFLMVLYPRSEFDAICTGSDRHAKFAKWAVQNHGTWTRETERMTSQYYQHCRAAANSFKPEVDRA
jgi:hypothetical protein